MVFEDITNVTAQKNDLWRPEDDEKSSIPVPEKTKAMFDFNAAMAKHKQEFEEKRMALDKKEKDLQDQAIVQKLQEEVVAQRAREVEKQAHALERQRRELELEAAELEKAKAMPMTPRTARMGQRTPLASRTPSADAAAARTPLSARSMRSSASAGETGTRSATVSPARSRVAAARSAVTPRSRAMGSQPGASAAAMDADAKGKTAEWANALDTAQNRLDTAQDKTAALKTRLRLATEDKANTEATAKLHRSQRLEATTGHLTKMTSLNEREAKARTLLDTTRPEAARQEVREQQMADGLEVKKVALEGDRQRHEAMQQEKADEMAKAEAKAARIKQLREAEESEKARAKVRMDHLAETVTAARKLHNEYLSLKGNIRVFCRMRPLLESEASQDSLKVEIADDAQIEVHSAPQRNVTGTTTHSNKWQFSFDHVFGPSSGQAAVWEEISLLVQSALDGYKVAIFAYGQTGSGKTYTMDGPPQPDQRTAENAGVIPRTVDLVFAEIQVLREKGWTFELRTSMMEVYNETVLDLLAHKRRSAEAETVQAALNTSQDGSLNSSMNLGRDADQSAIQSVIVDNASKVHALLKRAARERHVAATNLNDRSSRSHAIFQLSIVGRREAQEIRGLLSLVDLAGSERVEKSGATGERMKEAQHINKSLSALGDVVEALARRGQQSKRSQGGNAADGCHVPYRNSKLTMLLKESLGGDSKALMFVNTSPYLEHIGETLSSLRFAAKVHACNVGVARRCTEEKDKSKAIRM
eukprot:TRINITY_DN24359_c0_g2_i1.p1 TRINITY_DN24359_c0_g2~~TRINITY_DN24359_c0_g2_i1.p1  ORF type:complete len:760 (-),score=234.98 TRINITY_DN24359_c0_g2_i1:365-2644(-)